MTNEDWDILLFTIRTGNCVLLLGPDVSTEEVDGERKTRSAILANLLANQPALAGRPDVLDTNSLSHVAQHYASAVSPFDLQLKTAQFYQQVAAAPHPVYADIAALPFGLVVNATPESSLEQAYAGRKPHSVDWYSFRGDKKEMAPACSQTKPLIYYLYGSAREPQSLVISENDLLDFLVAIISKNPPLPSNIRSEFRSRDKCFLFLGFGFQQWYLRILLHVLQEDKRNSRSFAFEDMTCQDDPSLQHAIIFYKEKYKLGVYPMGPGDFVKELRRRYEAQPSTGEVSGASGREDLPTVFLCHASEDKDYAVGLSEKLEHEEIRPWLDRYALEGGDRWDGLIQAAIRKKVDYVVVLQSQTLDRKTVGYVNKEVELAVERQKEYRFPSRFIIPAKIEECEGLEDLAGLQHVLLYSENGVAELAKIIKRDYQRRRCGSVAA